MGLLGWEWGPLNFQCLIFAESPSSRWVGWVAGQYVDVSSMHNLSGCQTRILRQVSMWYRVQNLFSISLLEHFKDDFLDSRKMKYIVSIIYFILHIQSQCKSLAPAMYFNLHIRLLIIINYNLHCNQRLVLLLNLLHSESLKS